ncbi:hypothetical protein GCM10010191_11940 [Actinomadura vinacea]|uniref:Transposase putative helix-turn-helix domain-containing protein n=1 Tax=Actinomadura vinacea TaxID=115336 RepID=A0ABP5VKT1_9ACTN
MASSFAPAPTPTIRSVVMGTLLRSLNIWGGSPVPSAWEEAPPLAHILSVPLTSLAQVPRYRLRPTPAQERALAEPCAHARFVWNLACEQHAQWRPGRGSAPGFAEQCRQLSQARSESAWLRAGSVTVQQQALKDFAQAMANFFAGTHRRPTWRKAGRHEGFRIVAVRPGDMRRLSRRVGEVRVPKVGWVRFRWSRPVPDGVKSYRVTCDRAGRWHVAFAHVPASTPAPGTGQVAGVDRGVAVSAALSTAADSRSRGRFLLTGLRIGVPFRNR